MKGICDRCGFECNHSALRKEWTGLMVCSGCFDRRHPQEFVRAIPDRQGIRPNMRPEPTDVFVLTDLMLQEDGSLILAEQSAASSLTDDAIALEG